MAKEKNKKQNKTKTKQNKKKENNNNKKTCLSSCARSFRYSDSTALLSFLLFF